MRQTNPKS